MCFKLHFEDTRKTVREKDTEERMRTIVQKHLNIQINWSERYKWYNNLKFLYWYFSINNSVIVQIQVFILFWHILISVLKPVNHRMVNPISKNSLSYVMPRFIRTDAFSSLSQQKSTFKTAFGSFCYRT